MTKLSTYLALILVSVTGILSCGDYNKLNVEGGNPPKFVLSGDITLKSLRVSGPDQEREAQRGDKSGDVIPYTKVYWEIRPKEGSPARPLNQLGSIVYGEIPEDFVQIYPAQGTAPALSEGDTYTIQLSTGTSRQLSKFFVIRNGKVVAERD